MKDLYIFDQDNKSALASYKEAQYAYVNFFKDLEIPFEVAQASSGSIGGTTSHEFHFPHADGDDSLCICNTCAYCANEEIAKRRRVIGSETPAEEKLPEFYIFTCVSYDRLTLFVAFSPKQSSREPRTAWNRINLDALKMTFPNLDPSVENPLTLWIKKRDELAESETKSGERASSRIVNVYDRRLSKQLPARVRGFDRKVLPKRLEPVYARAIAVEDVVKDSDGNPLDLMRIQEGDPCPRCDTGKLQIKDTIEVGHTFLLGTRYSEPLRARVALPGPSNNNPAEQTSGTVYMGCYGIGITRLIGAIAEINADELGLKWPRRIAPFEIVVVAQVGHEAVAERVYDVLAKSNVRSKLEDGEVDQSTNETDTDGPFDVVIDDRDMSLVRRLVDAELSGYPVRIIVGKDWKLSGKVEVQCRKIGKARDLVELERLPSYLAQLFRLL